jgi:hypothetical protein
MGGGQITADLAHFPERADVTMFCAGLRRQPVGAIGSMHDALVATHPAKQLVPK